MRITITTTLQTKTVVRSVVEVMLLIPAVEDAVEKRKVVAQADVVAVARKTAANVVEIAASQKPKRPAVPAAVVAVATKLRKLVVNQPRRVAVPAAVVAVAKKLRKLAVNPKSVVANVVVKKLRRPAVSPKSVVANAAVRKPRNPKKDIRVI
tara:strand:- start:681 stop:1136 length:456 start_codon:yes stop_codon:yes gene_type:complete